MVEFQDAFCVKSQGMDFQAVRRFDIFQQLRFFLDGGLLPALQVFSALLHPPGFLAVIGHCIQAFMPFFADDSGALAHFCGFHLIRPFCALARRRFQALDVLFQLFVFRLLEGVLPPFLLLPYGKISGQDLNVAFVQRKRMVRASIQQRSVMRYQQKAGFLPQVFAQRPAAMGVQVVRRLVDEQKLAFVQKQRRQHTLHPFAARKRFEGPVERFAAEFQQVQLPQQLPLPRFGAPLHENIQSDAFLPFHRNRKIIAASAFDNLARAWLQLLRKQAQKRGFAAPVAANEAAAPVGIKGNIRVFKNIVVAALISEREPTGLYHRHNITPPKK